MWWYLMNFWKCSVIRPLYNQFHSELFQCCIWVNRNIQPCHYQNFSCCHHISAKTKLTFGKYVYDTPIILKVVKENPVSTWSKTRFIFDRINSLWFFLYKCIPQGGILLPFFPLFCKISLRTLITSGSLL